MRVIRAVVADDDAVFREALVEVLEADRRFKVAGVARDGGEAVRLVRERDCDLLVLDVRMPGGGEETVRALADGSGGTTVPVVGLSAQHGVGTVAAMLRAGAVGYLLKGRVGADLPDLLARCAAGEVVLAVSTGAEALRQVVGSPAHP